MEKKKDKKVDIDIGKIWEKYRYVSGLDIKLPKFNLKKIDAKEVLHLLNSGDREYRKKLSRFYLKLIANVISK